MNGGGGGYCNKLPVLGLELCKGARGSGAVPRFTEAPNRGTEVPNRSAEVPAAKYGASRLRHNGYMCDKKEY